VNDCTHEFIYLRQERKNIGYDRDPKWLVEDVFFCNHCLTYRRVAVEERTPRRDSLTEEYVKRLV
jgi:hypothetical protein